MGRAKAPVFPDPVWESPITSFPAKRGKELILMYPRVKSQNQWLKNKHPKTLTLHSAVLKIIELF